MVNASAFYEDLGRKSAAARNQKDEARAKFHAEHFRRARDLESDENRQLVSRLYSEAYQAARII